MAVDFEAEGLLDGLEDPQAREARAQLLRELSDDGVPLEELKRAVAEDRLALLPLERVIEGEGPRYTREEVARRVGIDREFLDRLLRALGVVVDESDEERFGEADVDAARRIKQFLDAGMPEDGLLEITRVLGHAMGQVSDAIRGVTVEAFMRPGDTERDLGLRYAELARQLQPQAMPLFEYVFNLRQREQIRHEALRGVELAAGRMPGARPVTVSFADMVGFTRLGEQVAPDELGRVAGRLGELAADVAIPPVRLVKLIGDAAMLVAPETEPLLEASFDLVDAVNREGDDFPQLRVGVAAGDALMRSGDWYGRPVNLASRITSVARPDSVLATEEVHEAAEDRYRWSFAGSRRLKGIRGEVPLFRARRKEAEEA